MKKVWIWNHYATNMFFDQAGRHYWFSKYLIENGYKPTITVNVHVGTGCLINKHSVIGHDVTVGDYTVISPNVSIGGDVNIGSKCYLGSGSIIRNGIKIGENSIIGMGSVVLKDVEPNSIIAGNPAKFLRFNEDKKVFRK